MSNNQYIWSHMMTPKNEILWQEKTVQMPEQSAQHTGDDRLMGLKSS